jgi:hypothetical protein
VDISRLGKGRDFWRFATYEKEKREKGKGGKEETKESGSGGVQAARLSSSSVFLLFPFPIFPSLLS